jgi:hypothetical protein
MLPRIGASSTSMSCGLILWAAEMSFPRESSTGRQPLASGPGRSRRPDGPERVLPALRSLRVPRRLFRPNPDQEGLRRHDFVSALELLYRALDLGPGRRTFGVGGVRQQLRNLLEANP